MRFTKKEYVWSPYYNNFFLYSMILLLYHKGRVWSRILIVHGKSVFLFCFVFSKYFKNNWNFIFCYKKIDETMAFCSTKKALMTEHRKNYIFRNINDFVKMSVSTLLHYQFLGMERLKCDSYLKIFFDQPHYDRKFSILYNTRLSIS